MEFLSRGLHTDSESSRSEATLHGKRAAVSGPVAWYDGTSTRTGPLQSKKIKIELKDNAKNMIKNI